MDARADDRGQATVRLRTAFAEQMRALVVSIGLSTQEWQTVPLLMNLPPRSVIAALVLMELHGCCGEMPAGLRLTPLPETTPPQFEVAEIVDLQEVRKRASKRR
jgi:hypothetical protein